MSGDGIGGGVGNVNEEHRDIGPLDRHTKHIVRPILVVWVVAPALVLGGFLLESRAPGLFATVGGWATVVGLLAVTAAAVSMTMVRRMRRRSTMPDPPADPSDG